MLAVVCAAPTAVATAQLDERDAVVDSGDRIRYRTIERADFNGKESPIIAPERSDYELNAVTCVYLRTNPDVSLKVGSRIDADGTEHYEGWVATLGFRALMDRSCSWWNPRGRDPDYTLQHEQIHFALHEVAARRLNEAAARLVTTLHVTAVSEQEVVETLETRIGQLFDEHNAAASARNRRFDEETSWGHDAERQSRWWRTVEAELRETESWR
jgi:hypothetical protein